MTPADLHTSFGTVLRRLRAERGMTQEDLAFASGAGRAAIARMETGRQLPSMPTLVRLAAALGVDASEVVRLVEQDAMEAD